MMTTLLAIVCGCIAGCALGLVGGGGSILATPLLLYVVGVRDPHVAIGTASVAVAVAALVNFAAHARLGHVRWRNALVFAGFGTVGALSGSALGKAIDGEKLLFLYALLMFVVGLLMLRKREQASQSAGAQTDLAVAGLALLAGTVSGLFGIGGGFLIVPCLLFATDMSTISAVGSSLLAVTVFSGTTAASYARSGLVDWDTSGWFVLGGTAGGAAGVALAVRVGRTKDRLRKIFACLLFAVAAYVLVRSLTTLSSA